MLARQHYYLQDGVKADYYIDRYMRGKYESNQSSTKQIALLKFKRSPNTSTKHFSMDKLQATCERFCSQISKIQKLQQEAFYKSNMATGEHEALKKGTN